METNGLNGMPRGTYGCSNRKKTLTYFTLFLFIKNLFL